MPSKLPPLLGALVLLLSAASTCQAQFVFKDLSDAHLRRILRGLEYREYETLETDEDSTTLLVTIDDWNVILTNYRDSGDLRIYAIFENDAGETEETLLLANEWNRDYRFAKLIIDESGDWILESDFDAEPGITEAQVEAWIELYVVVLNDFVDFLNENI